MFRYGFELEGFLLDREGNLCVAHPNKGYPLDGHPGIIEIRNTGGGDLNQQYFNLFSVISKLPKSNELHFSSEFAWAEFSGEQLSFLRKHHDFHKETQEVFNLYNKAPKRWGNKNGASFQINVSNLLEEGRSEIVGTTIRKTPDKYGLLDISGIVRRLDEEFREEIIDSGRQIGCYTIKDNIRLEYRSLPNTVFTSQFEDSLNLINRIRRVVEN